MMNSPYIVVLALCLSGLGIRVIYEELKKNGKIDPKNIMIFPVVVLGMSLFLPSWALLGLLDPWRFEPPNVIAWLGILMIVAGTLLAITALVSLRGVENIDHLVTGGLFSYLRHPMYTGFILWILGWIVLNGALMSLIPAAVSITCILYWARLEEAALIKAYGNAYQKYRKMTWL
jgi:protein-S-isoprenylcysteine O-methyltransferase Ste14